MNIKDEHIKEALQKDIQPLEDDSFTETIVEKHLSRRRTIKNNVFMNFLPMIVGLSVILFGIGIVLLARQKIDWISEIGLTDNHGYIVLMLSTIFLLYKLVEEITTPDTRSYTSLKKPAI